MQTYHYPKLPEGAAFAVELILRVAAENPDFYDNCPYDLKDIDLLKRMSGMAPAWMQDDPEEEDFDDGDKWGKLERQTKRLFDALLAEQQSLGTKDNAEKMSFFRTATSLLEKLVGIQERAANLRQIHQFHNTVMQIMDDVLDEGQRTEVRRRLQAAIKPEENN